jgi:lysophospholipase L1-like esterase
MSMTSKKSAALGAIFFVATLVGVALPGRAAELEAVTKDVIAPSATVAATNAITVFMIGDSTMADKPVVPANPERGWGQLLPTYFKEGVRVENHAVNGRSSKSFRDEGRWKTVLSRIKTGDYVIIQFGHNDEKSQDKTRFTEPFGAFTENLTLYVKESRNRGAHPIFATAIVRRKFNADGKLEDTHGDYIKAVRELAPWLNVPLLDLNRRSEELVQRMGPQRSKQLFKWTEPGDYPEQKESFKDDTHLNAFGASRICDLAVGELKAKIPDLAKWLK